MEGLSQGHNVSGSLHVAGFRDFRMVLKFGLLKLKGWIISFFPSLLFQRNFLIKKKNHYQIQLLRRLTSLYIVKVNSLTLFVNF